MPSVSTGPEFLERVARPLRRLLRQHRASGGSGDGSPLSTRPCLWAELHRILGWPTTRVADRHIFQPGAYGGLEPDEHIPGGDRVATCYPRDFATFVRCHSELKRAVPSRYPLPGPLSLVQLDESLQRSGERYTVKWLDNQLADAGGHTRAA